MCEWVVVAVIWRAACLDVFSKCLCMCEPPDPATTPTPTVPDLSVTTNPGLMSHSSYRTAHSELFGTVLVFNFYFVETTFLCGALKLTMALIKCVPLRLSSNNSTTCDCLATEWNHFWKCTWWVIIYVSNLMLRCNIDGLFTYNKCVTLINFWLHLGSGLELFCKVLTEYEMADSTVVTWLVNGQSVESSYLDGRALQGGRR